MMLPKTKKRRQEKKKGHQKYSFVSWQEKIGQVLLS
jgi:hypothetical protein